MYSRPIPPSSVSVCWLMKSPASEPLSSRACALISLLVVGVALSRTRALASVGAVVAVPVLAVVISSIALSNNDMVIGEYSGLVFDVSDAHIES